MNHPRRSLLAPALKVLGVYLLAAIALWWLLPPRPRFAFKLDDHFGGASRDGEFVYAWSLDKEKGEGTYRILEAATGRECYRLVDEDVENPPLIDFGSEGHTVFCFSVDGRWMVVDPRAGKPLIDRWQPRDLSFNPTAGGIYQVTEDGRSLVLFRARLRIEGEKIPEISHPRVEVWDLETGQLRAAIEGVDRAAVPLAVGGTLIAAEPALPSLAIPIPGRGVILPAGLDLQGTVKDWGQALVIRRRDLITGRPLDTLPRWVGRPDALAVAPDGGEVAVGIGGVAPRGGEPGRPIEVRRWDPASWRELAAIRPDPSHHAAEAGRDPAISEIRYWLARDILWISGDVPHEQVRWDIAAEPPQADRVPGGGIHFYSRDGRWIAQEHNYSRADPELAPGGISILEASTLRERFHIWPPGVKPLGFSPDGRLFLVRDPSVRNPLVATARRYFGSREGWTEAIRAYDVETGRAVGAPASTSSKYGGGIHPDGTLLLGGEGGYEAWDVPPRPPWGAIFGFAAIPAAIALGVGWRRRSSRPGRWRSEVTSVVAAGGPSLTGASARP